MAEKKERKPWQEMTSRELDNDALIEHAKSLGRKKAVERRLKSIEDQNEGRRSVQLCRPSCYFCLGCLVPLREINFEKIAPYGRKMIAASGRCGHQR